MIDTGLTFEDTIEILTCLSSLNVVLVGGQALNYWALVFKRASELERFGPYASKDVDFQGNRAQVQRSACLLGGTARLPSMDEATPSAGAVDVERRGRRLKVDFVAGVYGLKAREVERDAVPVDVAGARVLVMHPVHCLESRVHNVAGLPHQYANEHGLNQLRAAIICAREYIGARAASASRPALKATERVFRFALAQRSREVYRTHGIEPFEAVAPWPALGEQFRERRYPQMVEWVKRCRDTSPS